MAPLVAASQVPYIAMHHQGRPDSMQVAPQYTQVVQEVFGFFAQRLNELRSLGINDVLLDPGFGFGKTAEHNFNLLDQLEVFHALGCPLLVGVSRKSMIYKSLDTTPELALNGTTAAHAWALDRGAHVLRVHDPKAAQETVRLHRLLTASRAPHA
jgi:dihydropteroate synthase